MRLYRFDEGKHFVPDKETVFRLREEGMTNIVESSSTDALNFNLAAVYFGNGPYVLKEEKGTDRVRVYHREGIVARFSKRFGLSFLEAEKVLGILPENRAEFAVYLAKANEIPFEDAARIYRLSKFDYNAATIMIEKRKGFPVEDKGKVEATTIDDFFPKNSFPLSTWGDPEVIAENVLECGTKAEDAFPELARRQ